MSDEDVQECVGCGCLIYAGESSRCRRCDREEDDRPESWGHAAWQLTSGFGLGLLLGAAALAAFEIVSCIFK